MDKYGYSSYYLLKELGELKSPNLKISFVLNPKCKNYHNFFPYVVSEIMGVQHSKILIFDNNVVLTGANMSENYFTNRQDRYWILQNNEYFADYCEDFHNLLLRLTKKTIGLYLNDNSILRNNIQISDYKQRTLNFLHDIKMFKYENRVKITSNDFIMSDYFNRIEEYTNYYPRISREELIKNKIERLNNNLNEHSESKNKSSDTSESDSEQENISNKNEDQNIKNNDSNNSSNEIQDDKNDFYIFPTYQFSDLMKIDHDESLLLKLLNSIIESKKNTLNKSLNEKDNIVNNDDNIDDISKIRISTGYFNPPNSIKNKIYELASIGVKIEIYTSSMKSNSFFGSKGIKGLFPYFYKNKLNEFNHENILVYEHSLENWTYHSKGIWFFNKNLQPILSVIGSSNYSKSIS